MANKYFSTHPTHKATEGRLAKLDLSDEALAKSETNGPTFSVRLSLPAEASCEGWDRSSKRAEWRGINLIFLVTLLLPACGNQTITPNKFVYDFAESVLIIRHLIKSNSLSQILDEVDPQEFEKLVNNFSPAQMALESEVLNCTLPVLIYFYEKNLDNAEFLEQLAKEYDDKVKIIIIDVDAFFSIAEQFEIQQYPAIVFMNKRDEVFRTEGNQVNQELISCFKNLII